MYKKIYITGATGFVGRNLTSHLIFTYPNIDIITTRYDLTNAHAANTAINIIRPDCVIHLAATCGGIGANKAEPGRFMRENLAMGFNIINAALDVGCVKKFINIGTVCSYPNITPIPFKEQDIWNGYPEKTNAPYGIAKKTLTELLVAYSAQYGFNSTNLYPSNMFGKHDHFNLHTSHVIPSIILKVHNAIINNKDSINLWGTGKASRDFLYVKDFCHAVNLTLNCETGPQPINIGTGIEYTIKQLTENICDIMDFRGDVVWDSSKPDGQPRRCLDITNAKSLLKYAPTTSLVAGLSTTIEWFYRNIV